MKKIALILIPILAAASCATLSSSYKLGNQAEINKNYDEAIAFYEKASLESPKESVYRMAIERVRISASLAHLQEARRLVAQGQREEAKAEYAKALHYNPRDTQIALESQQMTAEPTKEAPKNDKIEPPVKLKARDQVVQLRMSAESSLRSILLTLGRSAGVTVVFDENFRDVPFAPDLNGQTVEGALKVLCQATKNFFRVIDERTVIVVPDQPQKRLQYEINGIRTFYLSNIVAQDVFTALSQMLRTPFSSPNIFADKNLNTVTVRGTPEILQMADKLLRNWDKPKGEVLISVEIMEVSRTRLRQLGMSLGDFQAGITYGPASTSTTTSWIPLKGLDFGKAENYSITLPSAYVQLLESDSDTKIIAQPRLRGLSDEKISDKVGQKIPLPQTTFTPIAAGGTSTQPLTSYTQQDVGIEINFTPRVHREKEVTLEVEIKVSSLGGTGYADIPIINNRELKSIVRLKDGETQFIAGLLRDEERKTVKGIPGLKDIPGLGRLFGAENTNIEQSDVIMSITPYIIRSIPIGPEDLKPIWVDQDTASPTMEGGILAEALDREIESRDALRSQQERRPGTEAGNSITLSPSNFEVPVGREFRLAVNVRSDQGVGALSLTVNFNPRLVSLKDVSEGGLTRQMGGNAPFLKNIDNGSGVCIIGFSSPEFGKGVKGGGTLATLIFTAKAAGESMIGLSGTTATNGNGAAIAFQTSDTRLVVR